MKRNYRKWLNPKGHWDLGAIQASVETTTWNDSTMDVDATVIFWDCARKIDLAFGYNNEKEYNQRMNKIRTIIETLEQVECDLEEAHTVELERLAKRKDK